jgi:phosphatidylglycerol---prolipoprotein diacylglyceryl transferase
MLAYPNINPVALSLGPIHIFWYGIMYAIGFLVIFWILVRRGPTETPPWTGEAISDLTLYAAVGVIFGGTLGNFLFYDINALFAHPLSMFQFWEPGRSFHGGLLGVLIAVFVYAKVHKNPKRSFLSITDFIAPVVPIGLGAGRLGNFINGELWGKVSDVPWAMVFPQAGPLGRHPSQLYEFFLEGFVLFFILYAYGQSRYHKQEHVPGAMSGLFLMFYGLFRIMVELLREPERGQGYIAFDWLTTGQLLSLPMVIIGLILFGHARGMKIWKPI